MKNYIVGHKNPDTDSVVSAIAYARLKKTLNGNEEFVASVSGEINKETKLILEKFEITEPAIIPEEEKNVILVDHNEPSQIAENVNDGEIRVIVDHHKLGGLTTQEPIDVIIRPVGSTSTIIAQEAFQRDVEVDKKTASVLVCGILSDTLKLTSPTTTKDDEKILEKLNKIAQLDIDKIAQEMFEAKSDISDITTEELLGKDYKIFDMAGKKVGIGVWETTNPASILERKSEIHQALKSKKEKENLDHIFFAAIDIVEGAAHFILDTQPEIALITEAFEVVAEEGVAYAKSIVSRKKQIAPKIEEILSK